MIFDKYRKRVERIHIGKRINDKNNHEYDYFRKNSRFQIKIRYWKMCAYFVKCFSATFHSACMKLICIEVAFIYISRKQKDYASQISRFNVTRTEFLDKTHDANQCLSATRCPARDISATGGIYSFRFPQSLITYSSAASPFKPPPPPPPSPPHFMVARNFAARKVQWN